MENRDYYLNFYKEWLAPHEESGYLRPFNHVVIFCKEGDLKQNEKDFQMRVNQHTLVHRLI